MTQEEKAKAYDEVRDKIALRFGTNVADEVFSQFEMSEDEKIKKEIMRFIFDYPQKLTNRDSWLAWLEKQGEHANFRNKIQIGDKVTRNEDGVLVNISQLNRVAKKDEKQGEKGINGNERVFPIPEPPLTLKHAKEVMGIKQDDAWSKEDEKMLECAIDMIEWYSVVDKSKSKRVSDWLKSLRPQSTWKPSDEQLYWIKWVAYRLPNTEKSNKAKAVLEELLGQLMKLGEE